MNTYIFYTLGGYTECPDGAEVENCQLLGEAEGETAKKAFAKLLKENKWVAEHGFKVDCGDIVARKLADSERVFI